MTKPPIERLLDLIDWQRIQGKASTDDGMPYATHDGILRVGDMELRVFQLNDGRRVIAEEDLVKFFGFLEVK